MRRDRARGGARKSEAVAGFDGSPLRRALVALISLKAVGLILVFDPLALQAFDFPKSLYSRATEWLICALLMLALVRYGSRIVPRSPLHIAVGAFVLANASSAALAENKYLALFGEQDRYLGFVYIGDMAVLYLAIAVAFRRRSDWWTFFGAVAAATTLSVGYAALQLSGWDPIAWVLAGRDRPFSTFGNSDIYGRFLSESFGVALAFAAFAAWPPLWRLAAATGCALVVVVTGVVASRSGAIGIAAAVLGCVLLYSRLSGPGARRARQALVNGAAAVVVAGGLLALSPVGDRLRATLAGEGLRDRLDIYAAAVAAAKERPLTGYGPDNFGVAYPRFRTVASAFVSGQFSSENSAHSWPLQTAATTGVLGLGTQLVALAVSTWLLWTRGLREAPEVAAPLLLGAAAGWASGLTTVGALAVDFYLWVVLGSAVALVGERAQVRPRPVRAFGLMAAFILAGASIGGLSGLTALAASHDARVAQLALDRGDGRAAAVAAEAAVRRDPGRHEFWARLGVARFIEGRWREAGDAFAEAVKHAPHDAASWAALAQSRRNQALSGDSSARGPALAAARRATEVDPRNLAAHRSLVNVALALGDGASALSAALAAMRLSPDDADLDGLVSDAALAYPDRGYARGVVEDLITRRDSLTLHLAAGELALRLNDLVGARAHARRALELNPGNAQAQRILAAAGG